MVRMFWFYQKLTTKFFTVLTVLPVLKNIADKRIVSLASGILMPILFDRKSV